MDLSVASSLHGNKITADKDLGKSLVPEIRNITGPTLHACASHHRDHKIHGLHHWQDGMAYFKTHVELMLKRYTD